MTLSISYLPLDDLLDLVWDDNPKSHKVDKIKKSMKRWGFTQPMGRGDNNLFYAGHGRMKALCELRAEAPNKPPTHIEFNEEGQWCAPVINGMTFASHHEYMAYVIADNQLTIDGGWDLEILNDQLREIERETNNLEGTGFTIAELDQMLADASVDVTPPDDGEPPQEGGPRKTPGAIVLPFELTPPDFGVAYGDVWQLNCEGAQHLIVVRTLCQHWEWRNLLHDNYLLLHAPTPDLIISTTAMKSNILAVTPDVVAVSHLLGRWTALHGHGSAKKL